MVNTIVFSVTVIIAITVASAIFAKEMKLRITQRHWADLTITAVMFTIVALLVLAAIRALLAATGGVEYLESLFD